MANLSRSIKKTFKRCGIGIIRPLYRALCSLIPVDKKLIVFDASRACNYTGNPRAVYEYMLSQGLDQKYRLIWAFQPGKKPEDFPASAKTVNYRSPIFLWVTARARVWLFDARNNSWLKKKKNQTYIQTWHGTPLKKLALDMESHLDMKGNEDLDKYKKGFYRDTRRWDYLVAQNSFSAEVFRRCFAFDKKMLTCGYPRNDILFSGNNSRNIAALKEKLGLPMGKKILLYAPTYRDDEISGGQYAAASKLDMDLMREKLGDEWVIIAKYHYFIANKMDWSAYKGFVFDYGSSAEISELYLVSDAMVTDYSSVMFDYALLCRPIYFYCYDLEKYASALRGFYFNFLEEAPGPISQTTEDLLADILTAPEVIDKNYCQRRQAFADKFNTYDDGSACRQICELIQDLCRN